MTEDSGRAVEQGMERRFQPLRVYATLMEWVGWVAFFVGVPGLTVSSIFYVNPNASSRYEVTWVAVACSETKGLAAFGDAGADFDTCRLDVMYRSLREGSSVGQASLDRVKQVLDDAKNGVECVNFYLKGEFLARIFGDPFLRLYNNW